ncbi:MAG: UDP-N-acetylmuramoyl-L-alanyl-D-glutamate--2,6-diaminopimelate ligase [Planctomycetota bacterium]
MITIADLLKDLPATLAHGSDAVQVSTVVEDSRDAVPGSLFVARRGAQADGRAFIQDAHQRGAVAVLSADPTDIPPELVSVVTSDVAGLSARIAERCAGSPSQCLAVVGVTGTNGKTTTCALLRHVIHATGHRCGLIGTVEVDDGTTTHPASLTTPGADRLSRWLRQMHDNKCAACAMEVSSHALDQQRTAGITFRGAIFTNLSGDHLDYHGSMDDYANAKAMLFKQLPPTGFAIINIDDAHAPRMVQACRAEVITVSSRGGQASYIANVHDVTRAGVDLTVHLPGEDIALRIPLLGRHNVENALLTIAAAERLGLDRHAILDAVRTAPSPPGRLERVTSIDAPFDVIVDYAHTDDALANVLTALRPIVPLTGRLRVVFGCGGDRDTTKRPRMARIAHRLADEVIVTSDNPRTEDPDRIIEDVLQGIPAAQREATYRTPDRAAAIEYAIDTLRPDDVVLIAGKGHEDYQIIGTERRPFDDRVIATDALQRIHGLVPA